MREVVLGEAACAPGEGREVGGLSGLQDLPYAQDVWAAQLGIDAIQALGALLPGLHLSEWACLLSCVLQHNSMLSACLLCYSSGAWQACSVRQAK